MNICPAGQKRAKRAARHKCAEAERGSTTWRASHLDNGRDSRGEKLAHMRTRLMAINASVFSPDRGEDDIEGACASALGRGGFWGPFLP